MGNLLNDKQFLNDNIFLFEKRLESQYTIFFDNKVPTFVTYYHINNINSITDTGFLNIEQVIGEDSPIRFQKIVDFPLYGIESIKLDLNEEEEGLKISFDGDAVVLPNTIQPLPNDLFVISYLGNEHVFMVTSVEYDTIKSNNFYKIGYSIRSTGDVAHIEKQVLDSYECIFKNIGTDDKCLIRSDEYIKLNTIMKWYADNLKKYLTIFYSRRYNSILFEDGQFFLYDKYLTNFIQNNSLFNVDNEYKTIHLSNEDYSNHFITEYDECFYKMVEDCDIDSLDFVRILRFPIAYPDSIFKFYHLQGVSSVLFNITGTEEYITDKLISCIKQKSHTDCDILEELIVDYFNRAITGIDSIDINELSSYRIGYNLHNFTLIPVVLFIIKQVIQGIMANTNNE